MQIPFFSATTINKYRDDLATALSRKAGNAEISDASFDKLAYITNDRLGYGLGAVFNGPFDDAPVLKSRECQLKLESLRSTLTKQREKFLPDSSARNRRDKVIDRVSKALPQELADPAVPSLSKPKQFQFRADTKITDGGREVQLLDKAKGKKSRSKDPSPTSEKLLSRFVKECRHCKADNPPSYSDTEMRQFWTAAQDIRAIALTLDATPAGRDLDARVDAALGYAALHRAQRTVRVWADQKFRTPSPPDMPGAEELLELIKQSGWRAR